MGQIQHHNQVQSQNCKIYQTRTDNLEYIQQDISKNRLHRNLFPHHQNCPTSRSNCRCITKNFPANEARCLNFSQIKSSQHRTHVTIYVTIKMPENKVQLQCITLYFFKSNNLWMNSPNITKMRKEYVGFVKGTHPNLLSLKGSLLNIRLGDVKKHGTTVQAAQYIWQTRLYKLGDMSPKYSV